MPTCPDCGGDGIGGDFVPELCGEGEDMACERCDGSGEIESPVAFYSVAIYLVDRAYGGPEEGGWYYDCGQLVDYIPEGCDAYDMVRIFAANEKEQAYAYRAQLQAKLDAGVNVGRREISSVLSEGMYSAEMMPGHPHSWPTQRPHYE